MSKIFSGLSSNFADSNTGSRFEFDTNGSQGGQSTQTNKINESYSSVVTSFSIYRLISEIVKPFTELPAYREHLIDERGNFLKTDNLTRKEKEVLTPFARLVIGIKRLVGNLSSSKLKAEFGYMQTAARAMAFECAQIGGDSDLFLEELQKSIDVLCEDGEAGNCACGDMGGGPQVGTANPALAGYDPVMSMGETKMLKRKRRDVLKDVILKP